MSEHKIIEFTQSAFANAVSQMPENHWVTKFCAIAGKATDITSMVVPPADYTYFASCCPNTQGIRSFIGVTLDSVDGESPQLHIRQIQTDPSHLRQGHAINAMRAIFQKAAQNEFSVQFTPFVGHGKNLAVKIAALHHQEFPSVVVHYSGQSQAITGERAYHPLFGLLHFFFAKTGIEYI